jgi:FMN phosphatase YigB (HAD superfamily)
MSQERVLETLFSTDANLSYMRGDIDSSEFAKGVSERLGLDISEEELLGIWESILAPNLEALPVLERLKGKYRLVLGSNTDPGHFRRSVELQPALGLFDDLLLSYELGVCKPDSAFFERGLASLDIPAQECVLSRRRS